MARQPSDSSEEQSRRLVYFAAERTLSSWVRTALSLMALGFVIDRFSLVVYKVLGGKAAAHVDSQELWHWGGSILIALGMLMAIVAGIHHLRFAQRVASATAAPRWVRARWRRCSRGRLVPAGWRCWRSWFGCCSVSALAYLT